MSNLALLIPMPDCNQSPRNMYQCQMGKQTMGTPCQNWGLQAETKLYRLQTPGSPLFRPVQYDNIKLDDFAMGTNAIVAVISYTVRPFVLSHSDVRQKLDICDRYPLDYFIHSIMQMTALHFFVTLKSSVLNSYN